MQIVSSFILVYSSIIYQYIIYNQYKKVNYDCHKIDSAFKIISENSSVNRDVHLFVNLEFRHEYNSYFISFVRICMAKYNIGFIYLSSIMMKRYRLISKEKMKKCYKLNFDNITSFKVDCQ